MTVYKATAKTHDDPPRYLCELHDALLLGYSGEETLVIMEEDRDCDDCVANEKGVLEKF